MDSKVVWTEYPCLFPETIPKPSRSFANCLEEKKRIPSHRAAGPDKDKATGASHKAKRFSVSAFQSKKSMPHYSLLPISPYLNITIYTYYGD